MKKHYFIFLLLFIEINSYHVLYSQQNISSVHALSMYGDIKYGPNFKNFDYVNPNAPKGGTVALSAIGTYDSLNPFILTGNSEAHIGLIYETLTINSSDEPFTEYGLLAESMEIPKDRSWIIYNLRPQAKWHDGTPVTADDVVFSFDILTQKGNPHYRTYYKDVVKAEKLSTLKVKFTFQKGSNKELPLIMGQLMIISKSYFTKHDFTKSSLDIPLGSGAYKISEMDPGHTITYQLDQNYWGKNLPVNKGQNNIGSIKYIYYRDETVAFEAFKAGEIDYYSERIAKNWATAYKGPMFDSGQIKKVELKDETPYGMQGFFFNTRKEIFKDKLVREALNYAFDFEWANKNLFYNSYTRINSYFANSELAAKGLPDKAELSLLSPYKNQLPAEVFTKEYKSPATNGSGNNRSNLRIATQLLEKAGWQIKNNKLINKKTGTPFEFEFLYYDSSFERILVPFKDNLEKLGITMKIRLVDVSQFINRVDKYDYDMISLRIGETLSPGNEQRNYWGSDTADIPGSWNFSGIKDPVVDALIQKIITADTRSDLITACKALDRVLLWGFYVVTCWYNTTERLAYWDFFEKPKIKPKYSTGFNTWWINIDKYNKLKNIKTSTK